VDETVWRMGQLTGQDACNDVRNAVEEEEFGDVECLDQHGEACCGDSDQGDYVYGADDIEDDVAWASQGLLKERHCFVLGGCMVILQA